MDIRNREGSTADYHAFILDFGEKAEALLGKNIINEYKRVTLFLQAFSDKIGDKLCKTCDIDLDDPTTITARVFTRLKREALQVCASEDSQMRKLFWKQVDLQAYTQDINKEDQSQERKKEKEKKKGKSTESGCGKKNRVDDLTNMMKDLKIYQLEAQRWMSS